MPLIRRLFSGRAIDADAGLLILRLGAGLSLMLFHGYGKISAGAETWAKVGAGMDNLGITFAPAMWGFLAAFAEFFGAMLLVLGVAVRPAAAMVAFTMLVAAVHHLSLPADNAHSGFSGASHALEFLSVAVALLLAGPGRYTVARFFSRGDARATGAD